MLKKLFRIACVSLILTTAVSVETAAASDITVKLDGIYHGYTDLFTVYGSPAVEFTQGWKVHVGSPMELVTGIANYRWKVTLEKSNGTNGYGWSNIYWGTSYIVSMKQKAWHECGRGGDFCAWWAGVDRVCHNWEESIRYFDHKFVSGPCGTSITP